MHRRSFVKYAAVGAVATASSTSLLAAPIGADTVPDRRYSGADLDGWEESLGAGNWAAPGQAPVDRDDIDSVHAGTQSILSANIARRGVMAHNINVKRIADAGAHQHVHIGAFDFRLPYRPVPGSWPDNAQTIEGGLFVGDGGGTGKDHGVAFQWVLNPWMSSFGDIWCRTQANGGSWGPSTSLAPDQRWHRVEFVLDIGNASASMSIDGVGVPAAFVTAFVTEDEAGRGTENSARLQAGVISLWPGNNPVAPRHRAGFRNWSWDWYHHGG